MYGVHNYLGPEATKDCRLKFIIFPHELTVCVCLHVCLVYSSCTCSTVAATKTSSFVQ